MERPQTHSRILIVEDENTLATTLRDRLQKEGFSVVVAKDGTIGLDLAQREAFDLIVLDLMLPGQNGLKVCERLRQAGYNTPILMLTARRQTNDKVAGLQAGADDYLTKPFQMAEFLARIEALLRRAGQAPTQAPRYQFGDWRLDVAGTEVFIQGKPVPVSAKEFKLLRYFAEHPKVTLSREVLLREVWGYNAHTSSRTVDVHVAWLRQKIEKDPQNPQWILTVMGLGYKFSG